VFLYAYVCRGYKLATKILKIRRNGVISENMITENLENTPFATQGSPNLIREGGRTVGSGRVATIIE
jgi:translation elongation factor EF-Tu-like GTPase